MDVPFELHKLLAGQKRRELMQTYDVHILMPPIEETSDQVKVGIHKKYSVIVIFYAYCD